MVTGLPLQNKLRTYKKRRKNNNVRAFFAASRAWTPHPPPPPQRKNPTKIFWIRVWTVSLLKTFYSAAKI